MTRCRLTLLVVAVSSIAAMAAASGAAARVANVAAKPKHHFVITSAAKSIGSKPKKSKDGPCAIHSLPSFVETGLGATASSVADVITVECQPVYAEDTVTISSDELSSRCRNTLSWYSATAPDGTGAVATAPDGTGAGASFNVTLDNDGNATAVVWGGPSCAAGTSSISAHLNAPPYTTTTTTYTIIAPRNTRPGVYALPAKEVEDSTTSSAATIVYAEFPSVDAEQAITIRSNELDSRCTGGVEWVGPDEVVEGTGPTVTTTLDDNGNAFVVALAGPSCASGTSRIEASLNISPFTSYFTSFDILSPRVTNH